MKSGKNLITLITFLFLASFVNGQVKSGSYFFDPGTPGYTLNTGNGLRYVERDVTFNKPFESKPRVSVTVVLLDAANETKIRYSVEAKSVSRDGFSIKAAVWGDTQLNGIGGYWLAELEPLNLNEEPIVVGKTIQLNNIFFDFNKSTLKSESFAELDKVVDFLKKNNTVEIEIAGHTDNKGSEEYNQKLSQQRADAVVEYLKGKGIVSSRLTSKGYGEAKPIATNATDSGREQNRRVEFTITKK